MTFVFPGSVRAAHDAMEVTILGLGLGGDDGRCEEEAANYSWLLILCCLLRDEMRVGEGERPQNGGKMEN